MRPRVVFMLLLVLVVQAVGASAQVTAIRAGRVVDPDAGTAAENQVILIEQGKITLHIAPFEPSRLIEAVEASMSHRAREQGLKLVTEIAKDQSARLPRFVQMSHKR
mgnify:CR=1 FL=1